MATSGSSPRQAAANPTFPFGVTITVRPATTPTALPTEAPAVRIAAQPTQAPTPTTYTIEPDDTLLEIAIRFNVSVEELQLANPEVDPRALQIGQVLVIPTDASAPSGSGQSIPIAPPPPLTLVSPSCYATPTKSLVCLGLVENPLSEPIGRVQIAVQLLGNNGLVLGERIATTEQMILPPNGLAPYRVQFADIAENQVAGILAEVTSASTMPLSEVAYVLLEPQNTQVSANGSLFVFNGEISNTTAQRLQAPRAVLTLTDDGGNVHGYRVWDSPDDLLPGESLSLSLPVRPFGLDGLPPTELTYQLHIESLPIAAE